MKGLTLILMTAVISGVRANPLMLKTMYREMRQTRHSSDQLNKLFKFSLPNFRCVQVETDETSFSLSFLEDLHESGDIPPLVNGGEWTQSMGCRGFIILASNYSSSRLLVEKTPRWSQHRIVVIIKGPPTIALNDALMGGVDVYRDADVVLVASGDLTSGYIMAQPRRYFTRFLRPRKWPYSEKAVKDFQGREIHVLSYNCTIFAKYGPYNKTTGKHRWVFGVEVLMFEDIAKKLNLKPKYSMAMANNKLWFKEPLQRRDANATDIAFCGILMTARMTKMDLSMSVPPALLCLKMVVPRPVPVNTEWDGVFHPFEPDLWVAIGIVLLAATFTLQRFTATSRKYAVTKGIQKYEGLGGSFIQLLSILVMTDVPQSTSDQGAVRHLLTWWAFYSMILTTCFSSGLISHLTNQEFTKKPNTIEELVKQKFRWAMERTPDFSELLNLEDKWQTRWKYRFTKVRSKEEHMKLLMRGKMALWGYYAHGGFALPDSDFPIDVLSNYEAISGCFMEYFTGLALRIGSPFENQINRYIQMYVEAGLTQALFRQTHDIRFKYYKYVYGVLRPTKGSFAGPRGLRIENVVGIMFIWILGAILSIIIFFLELAQKFKI